MTLRGARIVLTRPERDCAPLAKALRGAGARLLFFPALVLQASGDKPPAGPFDLAIFTSPAAVRFGLDRVRDRMPEAVAAPGEGTAERLRSLGVGPAITPPQGAGLAALLEAPALRSLVHGARVLLVCGRPLNRGSVARLRAAGARPEAFCAYERHGAAEPGPLAGWLRGGGADAIMVSSVSAVEALAALAERKGLGWNGIEWIVSSPRVADAVAAHGGQVGAMAASAQARALAAAASEWWSSKQP